MSIKITYTQVKNKFEEEGYTLLSTEYINAKSKLNYICPKGHTHSMTWTNFKTGYRCPSCAGNIKLTYNYVKDFIEKEGYILLSTTYINARTKLTCICSEGHTQEIIFDCFRRGHRCRECAYVANRGAGSGMWKGGVSRQHLNLPLYDTYAHLINKYHEVYKVLENNVELLGVCCMYCGKIFVPKATNVYNRFMSIVGKYTGENNFYCSDECKDLCPIFHQGLWPKGFKLYKNDRPNQKQWADLVKERDNYTCQNCGSTEDQMIAHHIDPVINNPIESMDLDNGKTLCVSCHKDSHNIIGCTYYELKC